MRQITVKQKENANLISGPAITLKIKELNGVSVDLPFPEGISLEKGEHVLTVDLPFTRSGPDMLFMWQLIPSFDGFAIFNKLSDSKVEVLVFKSGTLRALELRAFEPVLFRGIYQKELPPPPQVEVEVEKKAPKVLGKKTGRKKK